MSRGTIGLWRYRRSITYAMLVWNLPYPESIPELGQFVQTRLSFLVAKVPNLHNEAVAASSYEEGGGR